LLLLGFFLIHVLISFPFYSACHLLSALYFFCFSLTSSVPSASSTRFASPFPFIFQYFDLQICSLNRNR
jgi:hypothetical protein